MEMVLSMLFSDLYRASEGHFGTTRRLSCLRVYFFSKSIFSVFLSVCLSAKIAFKTIRGKLVKVITSGTYLRHRQKRNVSE